MVSRPRAWRSSASGEKTGAASRSSAGRSAPAQRELSLAASTAMVAQTSGTAEEAGRCGNRLLDLRRAVDGRSEHGFELRRSDVDAAVEQVAEEGGVAAGIARRGLRKVPYRSRCE